VGALYQLLRRRAQRRALILLSADTVVDSAIVGAVVGTLTVPRGRGPFTFTVTADPDSKFAIGGSSLTLSDTVSNGVAATHAVEISAASAYAPTRTRRFTINVEAA